MITNKNRLPLRSQSQFFKEAKRLHSKHFVVYWLGNQLDHARVAVIVPAKAFPKAVSRNQMKRKISGLLSKLIDQVGPRDLVIYCKRDSKEDWQNITQELEKLVEKGTEND